MMINDDNDIHLSCCLSTTPVAATFVSTVRSLLNLQCNSKWRLVVAWLGKATDGLKSDASNLSF